jgi:hypothetical protein
VITTPEKTKLDDEDVLARYFPSLTDSEFELLLFLRQPIADFKKNSRFKNDFANALHERGAISVRLAFKYPVLDLGFKRMEPGKELCNASSNRAIEAVMIKMGNAAVEQANGEK